MGVESLEHAAYGVLHELVLIKRVDVKTIDGKLGNLQFTQRIFVLCRGNGCHKQGQHKKNVFQSFHFLFYNTLRRGNNEFIEFTN